MLCHTKGRGIERESRMYECEEDRPHRLRHPGQRFSGYGMLDADM